MFCKDIVVFRSINIKLKNRASILRYKIYCRIYIASSLGKCLALWDRDDCRCMFTFFLSKLHKAPCIFDRIPKTFIIYE